MKKIELIIERAREIRRKSKRGGHNQLMRPYGGIPFPEFFESFIDYLEEVCQKCGKTRKKE